MVKFVAITLLLACLQATAAMGGTASGSGTDLDVMSKARALYSAGKLDEAIKEYSKISPSSDFWLDSLEERAWANTRLEKYEKALGDMQSITSQIWSTQVGPETYMLSAFVSLKICAYKDVLKKIDIFKSRMLPRVTALQNLVQQPLPADFWEMSDRLQTNQVSLNTLGAKAEQYPRYFFRDQKLQKALREKSNARVTERMHELAKADLAEIRRNLKKMKIIEIEVMQSVLTTDENLPARSKNLQFAAVDRDKALTFPVNDDEVWLDEVGHYEVKADKCPFNSQGRTL